jgi:hypothetical protein
MSTGMARRMSRLEAATEEDKDFGFWFGMLLASANGRSISGRRRRTPRLMSGSMRSSGLPSNPADRTTGPVAQTWRAALPGYGRAA